MAGVPVQIPSPDWSTGWLVPEDPMLHGVSKFAGATGVVSAVGAWVEWAHMARVGRAIAH